MSLLDALDDFFAAQGFDRTYWIAYSGGLDSHVLLSLCIQLRTRHPLKLKVIHVNHGLSPHAEAWALHCANVCQQADLDFVLHRIQVSTTKKNLEETLRKHRYDVFSTCLDRGDMLLTAHQQDDQAETVLLQLLRGAGPKGLAAMPLIKRFGKGSQGRPLLSFPRFLLEEYAKEHQLQFIDDESNTNIQLTRNYLRHEILPLLKKRWPAVANTLSRVANHCAEAQELLQELAEKEMEEVRGSLPNTLSVKKLLLRTEAKQRLILRTWIQGLRYPVPNAIKMQAIQNDVLNARHDAMPCVHWQEVELRRYRDHLYFMSRLDKEVVKTAIPWDITQSLFLPSIGMLQASLVQGEGLCVDNKTVTVRLRQGGEVLHVKGRGHRTLKNLFQEWGVPPWERNRMPLIYVDHVLVAIPGLFVHENYLAKENEMGYRIDCSLSHLRERET